MKFSLKLACLLLTLTMLLPAALISCKKDEESPLPLTLATKGASDYTIIYPAKSDSFVETAVMEMRNVFMQKFNFQMPRRTDTVKAGEEIPTDTKEILIGATNRAESQEAMKELKDDGYLIKAVNNRVVIVAKDDTLLIKAIAYFTATYVTPATEAVELAADLYYLDAEAGTKVATVKNDSVTLDLNYFFLTFDEQNSQSFLPVVAEILIEKAKGTLPLMGATEDGENAHRFEILFGACDRADFKTTANDLGFRDFYLYYKNGKLSVSAFSIYGYEQAMRYLLATGGKLTIPTKGLQVVYDYGNTTLGSITRNYENMQADDAWMVNICHRGDVTGNLPENSLASYRSCLDNGIDVIETDVRKTADGVWVLCHDDTINRTTNGTGTVADMTYAQLQQYFLLAKNGGSGAAVTAQKIPKFTEIIELCRDKALLNLDKIEPSQFQEIYDLFESQNAVNMAMFKGYWDAQTLTNWFATLIREDRELPIFSTMCYDALASDVKAKATSMTGLSAMMETGRDHTADTVQHIASCRIRPMCLTALQPTLENATTWTDMKTRGYAAIMTDEPIKLENFINGN